MTSTTDTTGHPDVTELSDLTEGLLPASRSADVRRHLDTCEPCADVHASLEEIQGLLGSLPEPMAMPDDVAERIDAALAAEAVRDGAAADESSIPTVGIDKRPSTLDDTGVSRETSVPADRPAGHARTATTGPGRKGHRRGGRRRIAVLGTVFTVAALGLGSVLLTSLNDSNGGSESDGGQSTAADTFAASTLENQVSDLLAKTASGGRTPRSSVGADSLPSTSKEPQVLKTPTVPGCVKDGIGRNDTVLATEAGIYQGTEALLVVLPAADDSTRVTAYVVSTACVSDPSVGKGEVLLTHTYTRTS
ncbi:zf-HC2 domain-containing protein [Streptomyces sp. NPDC048002]|uniref:anti-sigma factor family protein n=1 Tax=Streptomyces sp. NPDC048002 TaxID=3154344 RepID=UPI0033C2FDFD